jgi:hypothetical protein
MEVFLSDEPDKFKWHPVLGFFSEVYVCWFLEWAYDFSGKIYLENKGTTKN